MRSPSFVSSLGRLPSELGDSYFDLLVRKSVGEAGSTLPGERFTALSEVTIAVEALVECVEQTSVEYFVEALEVAEVLLEDSHIRLIEALGNLHDDRFLLQLPEELKNSIGNDHDAGLVL